MTKTAIVLFNLGGPDSPEAVEPFLFNLFKDPAIVRLPTPVRQILAKLISRRRAKIAQDIYDKIGGRSPIVENTQAQARALEKVLGDIGDVRCFVAMRYWYPFTEGAVEGVRQFAPDQILLLPLYPQFSTTTTASSLKTWHRTAKKLKLNIPTKTICCYPSEPGFIQTLANATRLAYENAQTRGKPRILFSAHGLPEKIVKQGDPYPDQCLITAKAIVDAWKIEGVDWVLCYQSRVGPLRWIGPATDDEIRRAGQDKVPAVIVPIAFVSDHSETLVELDIEYRHLAESAGVPFYIRVPVVSTNPVFIRGLAQLARSALQDERDCVSGASKRVCAAGITACPMR